MNDSIFERHELKYLINDLQRRYLLQTVRDRMEDDPHGESTVCNVYYDTPDFRLARRSLEKPVYKEKLRLRSYGPAAPEQDVFVELKKKYRGVVYKRRILAPAAVAERFLRGEATLPEDSQIGREIEYFRQFYGGLVPAAHLSYDRSAFFSPETADLRVTIDDNIRWRGEELSLCAQPGGERLLPAGRYLLEVKVGAAMPLWLARALSEGGIRQSTFSKYGGAYAAMLRGEGQESRGVCCA